MCSKENWLMKTYVETYIYIYIYVLHICVLHAFCRFRDKAEKQAFEKHLEDKKRKEVEKV